MNLRFGGMGREIETVRLGYRKRWLGINEHASSLVVRGDLGLFSLKSRRLINLVMLCKKNFNDA